MHGCSLPASKTSIFPLERSRISKNFACGAITPPFAALAGMLYLYKYFRFLLQKWPRKNFVACGAQIFYDFSNRNFFSKKLRLADPTRKCITYWDPDPDTRDTRSTRPCTGFGNIANRFCVAFASNELGRGSDVAGRLRGIATRPPRVRRAVRRGSVRHECVSCGD